MIFFSTAIEHHAVLHTLEKLEWEGYKVELLDVNSNGVVSVAQLERAIREDTCLVTVMYAVHAEPVEAQMPCWSNSSTKLSPSIPSKIGALYARSGIPMTRLIEGGDQEQGRRAGTENVPAIMGMAAALEEGCAPMPIIAEV